MVAISVVTEVVMRVTEVVAARAMAARVVAARVMAARAMAARKADWVTVKMPRTAGTGWEVKRRIPATMARGRRMAGTAMVVTGVTGVVESRVTGKKPTAPAWR